MRAIIRYLLSATLFLVVTGSNVCAQHVNVLIGNPELTMILADVDNPLLVQVPGIADDHLTLRCDDAHVFKNEGVWYVHPQKNDSIKWLSIKVFRGVTDGQIEYVGVQRFKVTSSLRQLACIATPNHLYRSGDRVPVAELTDSATRIVSKYPEYVDYPETNLIMMHFSVAIGAQSLPCTNDTLSSAAKTAIVESLTESEEVEIHLHRPRIGKRTANTSVQNVLKSSTFTIVR